MKKRRCSQKKKLQEFLDEYTADLSLDTVWEQHIKECSVCRDFYEGYREFLDLYEKCETGDPVCPSIPDRRERRKGSLPLMRISAAAALLVMIGAGGIQGASFFNRRQILKEETKLFVESLLDTEFLNEERGYESLLLDGWFEADYLISY
jgi:predicted anti-sigma-YlaC factor YlaD